VPLPQQNLPFSEVAAPPPRQRVALAAPQVQTREYFGARAMGGAYGAIFMLQAIGMGLDTFAGGWFYDRLGGYGWSFAAAAAVGFGAVLLALPLRAPRAALGHASPAPA